MNREGRPVIRAPKQLRLHPAWQELGWTGVVDEFNAAALLKEQSIPEPILITTNGTILAGFGQWRAAVLDGRYEINCIEYPLSEDQALQFIISHHRPQRGWNDFVRIRLALTQEPYFQQKALVNMRAGGKKKGSTNSPKADCIDVRQEIAKFAGTGTGNVTKVKAIRPGCRASSRCKASITRAGSGDALDRSAEISRTVLLRKRSSS